MAWIILGLAVGFLGGFSVELTYRSRSIGAVKAANVYLCLLAGMAAYAVMTAGGPARLSRSLCVLLALIFWLGSRAGRAMRKRLLHEPPDW